VSRLPSRWKAYLSKVAESSTGVCVRLDPSRSFCFGLCLIKNLIIIIVVGDTTPALATHLRSHD
jgi:hypothetical protein